MIKALFFDIDGTLVSFNTHKIPQSTIDAIHHVRNMGIKVFIATGRPMPFINNLEGLEYDGIMSVNGAYCVDCDGTVICKHPVPKNDIVRLVRNHETHPMPIAFAANDKAIICDVPANNCAMQAVFDLLDLKMPQSRPINEALDLDVMQVIAFFTEEEEPRIMSNVLLECDANRWHPSFADCIAKGRNKATGIDEICGYYGFNIDETAAFGDGGNDIEMLRHAGIGVAMGNASDEVKACADIVTASVDDDGIAKALNKLIGMNSQIQ